MLLLVREIGDNAIFNSTRHDHNYCDIGALELETVIQCWRDSVGRVALSSQGTGPPFL